MCAVTGDRSDSGMKATRLAVIGVGLIGERHAGLVRAHSTCSLVGICDADPGRKAIADRLGVPFHTSVEALLEQEKPSGAIVATPTCHHASVAELCAKRSVHTLIEKPIADTIDQARLIVETTRRCGTRVLVGHHRRHNALVSGDPLQAQLEHFCRVVQGEEAPILDAEGGAKSLAAALAVQQSALKGMPVAPSTIMGRGSLA